MVCQNTKDEGRGGRTVIVRNAGFLGSFENLMNLTVMSETKSGPRKNCETLRTSMDHRCAGPSIYLICRSPIYYGIFRKEWRGTLKYHWKKISVVKYLR